jgi:hypothetical protein
VDFPPAAVRAAAERFLFPGREVDLDATFFLLEFFLRVFAFAATAASY